jgi:hypothetical protein
VPANSVANRETYHLIATREDGIRTVLCKCLSERRANEHRDMLLRVRAFASVEIERHAAATMEPIFFAELNLGGGHAPDQWN